MVTMVTNVFNHHTYKQLKETHTKAQNRNRGYSTYR